MPSSPAADGKLTTSGRLSRKRTTMRSKLAPGRTAIYRTIESAPPLMARMRSKTLRFRTQLLAFCLQVSQARVLTANAAVTPTTLEKASIVLCRLAFSSSRPTRRWNGLVGWTISSINNVPTRLYRVSYERVRKQSVMKVVVVDGSKRARPGSEAEVDEVTAPQLATLGGQTSAPLSSSASSQHRLNTSDELTSRITIKLISRSLTAITSFISSSASFPPSKIV